MSVKQRMYVAAFSLLGFAINVSAYIAILMLGFYFFDPMYVLSAAVVFVLADLCPFVSVEITEGERK